MKPLSASTPPAWAKVTPREIGAWRAFCALRAAHGYMVKPRQAWITFKKHKLGPISAQELIEAARHDPRLDARQANFRPHLSTWINDYMNAKAIEVAGEEAPLPFEQDQVPDRERRIRARTREIMEREYLGHPSARRKAIREVDGVD